MMRVYRFGLLPPVVNGDSICSQMYQAHKFHNSIIENENHRRAEIRKVGAAINNEISELEEQIAKKSEELKLLLKLIGKKHSESKDKKTSKEDKTKVSALKSEIKAMNLALRH